MKGLSQSGHWPSGNPRYYYRRAGEKAIPMPDAAPDSDTFRKAWVAAIEGAPLRDAKAQHRTGTIGAAVRAFLASDAFLARATSTRNNWRAILEKIEARYGRAKIADLEARHIRQDLARLGPNPAKNRRTVWRALCRWAQDQGLIEDDPSERVRKPATPQTDGHTPWTDADAALFRERWPVGTMQRLAFELLVHTGAARRDVVRLGPGMVSADGYLTYRRSKSGSMAVVPWTAPGKPWFPASPYLHQCIAAAPKHAVFLSTAKGAARSDKSFGGWFSKAARAAGIEPGKTAHGVRKYVAVTMAERGATTEERMAILGHETETEARDYSKAANLKRVVGGVSFSNFPAQLEKRGEKR